MVFENNPHAVINMPQTNIFKTYSPRMREICMLIGCVDPKYYPGEDLQRDLIYYQNTAATDAYRHIHYSMEQIIPINKYLINMLRVFSADERAPNKLGQIAKTLKPRFAQENLENDGMFFYESEVVACFNLMGACRNVMNSKTSIKDDIRSINQIIKEDPNYFHNDKKRRQIMGLKVAVSNKQTVQVSAKSINERAIDVIHRKILDQFMPSIQRDSRF